MCFIRKKRSEGIKLGPHIIVLTSGLLRSKNGYDDLSFGKLTFNHMLGAGRCALYSCWLFSNASVKLLFDVRRPSVDGRDV
jgi:hypothetical protein